LITSEGIIKYNKVEYSLSKWIENLQDYLKSAMSYTNSRTLEEFKETEYVLITENALKRFNK
jgi:isopentenyl diphosphate isomerase/L-lactate dehydrogenase-like FMN-dependent dehydrogenase